MNAKKILLMCLVGMCAVFSAYAQRTFVYEGNPLITDKFTADPAPLVHDGKLYLYVGHDEYYDGQDTASGGKEFNITEWLCYSTEDMKTWTDHGSVLRPTDFKWAVGEAWASQVVEKDGKFYYYTTVQGGGKYTGKAVGVAVADTPVGPFVDAIGKPLVSDDMTSNGARGWWNDIDPTVLIEKNGQAWLCWGNGTCFMAKLKPNMIELDGEIKVIDLPKYVEGPWLHERNGIYYLTYASMGKGRENISYATSKSMEGPWEYQGELTGMAENSFTIHPGIAEFKDKWYLFYHNAVLTIDGHKGAIGRRSVCVDELFYNEDGTMKYVEQTRSISSPNGKIQLKYTTSAENHLSFDVNYMDAKRQHEILSIPVIGMYTQDGGGRGLILKSVSQPRLVKEDYTMLTGKRKHCFNEGFEYVYLFTDSLHRELRLNFRLYNDGIAFRYELPKLNQTVLSEELATYRITEETKRWMQKYNSGYEDFFPMTTTGENSNHHWGYPALIQTADDVWTLISEAGIDRQNSASSLKNEQLVTDYKVCPAENTKPITGNWTSPWRVMIIGSLADVVESTLVTDVSAPCILEDTDWIHPGNVSWIYWAYNHGSKDFQIVKKYIDMAAKLKWPYVLIDWEWDVMENGGTIQDALKYAEQRGVRTLLWYNSSTAWINNGAAGPLFKLNSPENREKEFAWLEENKVAGVKIDFFAGDTEETMAYCLDLLEAAAKHHLLVNFHGATIPRGWQRTYPNLMSVEAVYGAEWYNNAPVLTNKAASHNTTLPFTRNVVGPMDYTPCTFSDSQHPHITTHAHELALMVVFESALQHWADRPESYLIQPESVKNFMGQLPTVWDDTHLISGYPGEYVVMARQKGDTWYIAGLNGTDQEKMLDLDWKFLKNGKYQVTLFQDSGNKEQQWKVSSEMKDLSQLPNQMNCLARGGFVAVIKPTN